MTDFARLRLQVGIWVAHDDVTSLEFLRVFSYIVSQLCRAGDPLFAAIPSAVCQEDCVSNTVGPSWTPLPLEGKKQKRQAKEADEAQHCRASCLARTGLLAPSSKALANPQDLATPLPPYATLYLAG